MDSLKFVLKVNQMQLEGEEASIILSEEETT